MTIPADVRRQVVERAEGRCEYCGLSQAGQEALFHVDHVRREEAIRGRHPLSSYP